MSGGSNATPSSAKPSGLRALLGPLVWFGLAAIAVTIVVTMVRTSKAEHPQAVREPASSQQVAVQQAPPQAGSPAQRSACAISTTALPCALKAHESSGWMTRPADAPISLLLCFRPAVESGAYERIEYLDRTGAVRLFDPANLPVGGADTFSFTLKQDGVFVPFLAETCP